MIPSGYSHVRGYAQLLARLGPPNTSSSEQGNEPLLMYAGPCSQRRHWPLHRHYVVSAAQQAVSYVKGCSGTCRAVEFSGGL